MECRLRITHRCIKCGREYVWVPGGLSTCQYPPKVNEPLCNGDLVEMIDDLQKIYTQPE